MPKAHPMCHHIQKKLIFLCASQTLSHVILVISKSFFSQFSAFKLHGSPSVHIYMHAHMQIHIHCIHTHTLYTHEYTNITKGIETEKWKYLRITRTDWPCPAFNPWWTSVVAGCWSRAEGSGGRAVGEVFGRGEIRHTGGYSMEGIGGGGRLSSIMASVDARAWRWISPGPPAIAMSGSWRDNKKAPAAHFSFAGAIAPACGWAKCRGSHGYQKQPEKKRPNLWRMV